MMKFIRENWVWIVAPIVMVAIGIAIYTMIESRHVTSSVTSLGY